MPNVLILSLYGKSFFAEQRYKTLLPTLLARTSVHESLCIADATGYLISGWPNVILVADPVITQRKNADFASLLVKWTHDGGTIILMGRFAADVEWPDLNALFQAFQKDFVKPWAMIAYSKEVVRLNRSVQGMRTLSLLESITIKGTFLKHVPWQHSVYAHKSGDGRMCSTAYSPVGFGWLGYVGDMDYSEAAEKTIIAMCRLDEHKWNAVEDVKVPA